MIRIPMIMTIFFMFIYILQAVHILFRCLYLDSHGLYPFLVFPISNTKYNSTISPTVGLQKKTHQSFEKFYFNSSTIHAKV